jgi:hypothetical protein
VTLVLFGSAGYGAILGKLSVPSLGARAAAPLVYAYVFTAAGPVATLVVSAAVSLSGTLAMELVARIARQADSRVGDIEMVDSGDI